MYVSGNGKKHIPTDSRAITPADTGGRGSAPKQRGYNAEAGTHTGEGSLLPLDGLQV